MERELTPTERGYLGILNKGVLLCAEQARSVSYPTIAWLSNGQNISYKTAMALHKSGLVTFIENEDRPWYRGEYKISALGKRLLEEEKETV